MTSFFTKIFNYRKNESKSPLENYLIEVFAFCLEKDKEFQIAFIKKFNLGLDLPLRIQTQVSYKNGRPDIKIDTKNTLILIECKIASNERANQLTDYLEILDNSSYPRKILIYLTKYHDPKVITHDTINFIQIRWYDIVQLIQDNSNLITSEFKKYLIELGMETQEFTVNDLSAIQNISEAITKMDEVLNGISPYFKDKFKSISKYSSRSTKLVSNYYASNVSFWLPNINITYYIECGFWWYWEDYNLPFVGIRVSVNGLKRKENTELFEIFLTSLDAWETEEIDDWSVIGNYLPISHFMIPNTDQINKMINFLEENIEKVYQVKINNPKLNVQPLEEKDQI